VNLNDLTTFTLVANRYVDLLEEGIDVAFRISSDQAPAGEALMTRSLGGSAAGLYASPDYLARRGEPERPEELLGDAWPSFGCGAGTCDPR
jgi:DNA-binding transcriptional LysR family regulator